MHNNKKKEVLLKVDNFSFFYGLKSALKNICISIFQNKITALIGPSGCGKTTLLRSFNRMNELIFDNTTITGKIFYKNINIFSPNFKLEFLWNKMSVVSQFPDLFPMSILDNIIYPLITKGINREIALRKAKEVLNTVGLWDEVYDRLFLQDGTLSLSGGQKQRLCIARAIAMEPEVLLMDEPTSGLDPAAKLIIEELIILLKETFTIIIVTHSMQQTSRIADYTAFLFKGHLIEYRRTRSLFTNPKKKLTELYITGRLGFIN